MKPIQPKLLISCAAFLLIPFLGGNHLPLSYITIDRFWIETIFLFLTILALVAALLFRTGMRGYRCHLRFLIPFAPFLAITGASLAYSWGIFNTLLAINTLIWTIGVVYLLVAAEQEDALLLALVMGGGILAVCAMAQHLVLFPSLLKLFKEGAHGQMVREQSGIPFGSYLYHNMLGGYLAFLLPVGLFYGVCRRNIGAAIAAPLMISAMVLSSSRIAMGLGSITIVLTFFHVLFRKDMRGLIVFSAIVLSAFLITGGLLKGGKGQEETGMQGILQEKMRSAYSQASTVNTRTDVWRNGVRAFIKNPVTGFGAGNFEYGYRRYFDGGTYTRVAHNTFLKIAVELGIVGLACFLFYLLALTRSLWRQGLGEKEVFLLLSLVCGFLFGIVDFSFDVPSHVMTFFLISAIFLTRERPGKEKENTNTQGKSDIPSIVLVILVLSATIAAFVFTSRTDLSRKSLYGGTLFEENGLYTQAFVSYRDAIREMPANNEGYMRALTILIKSLGNEKDLEKRQITIGGIRYFLKPMAQKKDRDAELFFQMARGYALTGEPDKAEFYFRQALSYYPSSAYYIYEIASRYYATGRIREAEALVRSFDGYLEKYRTRHDPRGINVYRIRNLDADIQLSLGKGEKALVLAESNYHDARAGVFGVTSAKSREYMEEADLARILEGRVDYFRQALRSEKSLGPGIPTPHQ